MCFLLNIFLICLEVALIIQSKITNKIQNQNFIAAKFMLISQFLVNLTH